MTQRDEQVYIGHMLDTANKAIWFVQGVTREDFDNNELLRLSLTHLLRVIGEAAVERPQPFIQPILKSIGTRSSGCEANSFMII
jgi:uncharacterized protein with HEPN domain